MAQDEQEVRYEKRDDVADMAGEDYELQLCALLLLRGVNHCPRGFYLASNHNQAGSFDDIVLLWRQEVGNDAVSWRGMLLQLKHKQAEALGRKVFLPTSQDQKTGKAQGKKTAQSNFSLVKYYDSYRQKVRLTWQQMVSAIGDVPIEQVTVGIFTNTGVKKMDIRDVSTAPDIVDTGAVKDGKEISRITEITFSLEEEDVKDSFSNCADQSDAREFLSRFRLFCNQASLEKLKQLIKDELMVALGTSPGQATDDAYAALLDGVKAWWITKKSAAYLTANSSIWTDIVLKQLAELGAPLSSAVQALNLRYTTEATGVFNQVFSKAQGQPVVVVCERGCGLLAVGKSLHALEPARGLAVSAEVAERRVAEVSALLGSRACRWLLVLQALPADTPLSAVARQRLLDALPLQPQPYHHKTFVLVTESDGVPPDAKERWTRHDDNFSLLHLDAESQERLLQKTIIFQGLSTTVGDIVQGEGPERVHRASQLLSGRQVVRLCSGQGPPRVGAALTDAPRYFVERPLERRRALRDDVVSAPPHASVLALSGLPAQRRKQVLAEGARSFSDAIDQSDGAPPSIVVLQRDGPDAQFERLCKKWGEAGRSLHWLSWQADDTWRWERSAGDTWALHGHLADDGWRAEWPQDALALAPGERAVVVCAPPGFGKSTLLARLAASAKRRLPHALVLVVELGRHSRELQDARSLDAESVKKLLKSAAKIDDGANEGLDDAIFDFCLNFTGEAVVVLDGFDEISHYEEQFDKLAKGAAALRALLETTRVRKVWASTRPATCRPLEEAARALAFQLRGFSAREQERFFTLFLESTGADVQLPQVLRKISELQVRTSLRRQARSFQEVPLHAAMLAEVATSEEGSQILSDSAADLCRLYEIFFNKKADIYQNEKRKMAVHESHTGWEAATGRDTYQETVIVFALRALFAPEEVSLLLGEHEQEGEDEGEEAALADLAAHEQTGIVYGADAGRPHFVHRTFAEYFAALFFCWGYQPRKRIRAPLVLQRSLVRERAAAAATQEAPRAVLAAALARDDLEFFRDMLARMLCKDMALHMAVIQDDADEVQQLTQKDAAAATAVDNGGRTPLHVAAIYNSSRAARILLSQVADGALSVEDRVLCWRPLQYADLYGAWDVADALMDIRYSPDDLARTKNSLQTHVLSGTDLLRTFVQKGHCNLTRFLVTECGVSADAVTDVPRQRRPLHEAAEARDARLVRVLLEAGATVDAEDSGGRTPLQLLCAQVHSGDDAERAAVEAAGELLAHSARIAHSLSRAGSTPLHDAATKGSAPLLRCLLTRGDGVKRETLLFPNKKGQTALHVAAASNRVEALQVLLELGANPNAAAQPPDKTAATPLHLAARHGFVQEVRLLLAHGASPDVRDREGRTPLHYATTGQCVDELAKAGADPNQTSDDGLTPLSFAVANGCTPNLVAALVHHGADVKAVDSEGNSAIYMAAHIGSSRAVEIMTKNNRKAGEDALWRAVERRDAQAAQTLVEAGVLDYEHPERLRLLQRAAACGDAGVVAALLGFGFPATAADAEGRTALHSAAAAGSSEVCQLLLQYGANVRARDAQGRQPLHEATNEATARALLDSRNAELNAGDLLGRTPLHTAVAADRLDVARLLVKVGCDLESRDNEGNTPLHAAVAANHVRVVRLLLEVGADRTARNKQGSLPLDLARRLGGKGNKYEKIFEYAAALQKALANTKN